MSFFKNIVNDLPVPVPVHVVQALRAEVASLKEELALVRCGEPNHPDRAYAMKEWLKTFGHKVYCELKHGDVGFVLLLLQEGEISRGKAAEAIAELLVGNKPLLPTFDGGTFAGDETPSKVVAALKQRAEAAEAEKRKAIQKWCEQRRRVLELCGEVGDLKSQVKQVEADRAGLAAALEEAHNFISEVRDTSDDMGEDAADFIAAVSVDYAAILARVRAAAAVESLEGLPCGFSLPGDCLAVKFPTPCPRCRALKAARARREGESRG